MAAKKQTVLGTVCQSPLEYRRVVEALQNIATAAHYRVEFSWDACKDLAGCWNLRITGRNERALTVMQQAATELVVIHRLGMVMFTRKPVN